MGRRARTVRVLGTATLALVLALSTGLAHGSSIPLPDDAARIYNWSYDYTEPGRYEMVKDMAWYAGSGVEPMASASMSLNWFGGAGSTEQEISIGNFLWSYRIDQVKDGAPAGPVPYEFNIRASGSIIGSGAIIGITATVDGQGLNGISGGQTYDFDQVYSGTATAGSTLQVRLGGSVRLFASSANPSNYGQLIVDPFVYIDPGYAYADCFRVVLQPSAADGGVWKEVSRDWMNPPPSAPVPEPSSLAFLGTGLAGLVAYGVRRRK